MRKILVKMLLIGKATRRTSTFLKVYLETRVRVLFVSYVYRGERVYEIKFDYFGLLDLFHWCSKL